MVHIKRASFLRKFNNIKEKKVCEKKKKKLEGGNKIEEYVLRQKVRKQILPPPKKFNVSSYLVNHLH